MRGLLSEQIEFLRQCRRRFHTTGAIAPSSRFLARAMVRPLTEQPRPVRVLEVGPGTGAVTRWIVSALGAEDVFDLVEINESFVRLLQKRFEDEPAFQRVADRSRLHHGRIEDFHAEKPYDIVISGLPLNNFDAPTVRRILETMLELLRPGGMLSYFEYMYVRPLRKVVSRGGERRRLRELSRVLDEYLGRYRVGRDSVWMNLPPAWVQHLRKPDEEPDHSPTPSEEGLPQAVRRSHSPAQKEGAV